MNCGIVKNYSKFEQKDLKSYKGSIVMGFFDFIKNKKEVAPTDFEHLTKEGELPFGWIYRNKAFVDPINTEYSHFLTMWIDSAKKAPKEQYAALKSFVLYLEDVEKLCKSKGECFEFWFNEILVSQGYLDERKKELEELMRILNLRG